MDEQKGHRYLLDAMAALPAGSRLPVVPRGRRRVAAGDRGAGPRARPRRTGDAAGRAHRRSRAARSGDAYASATLQEGHPLSVLEAMAVGLPVVAPRIAAISEIAQDDNPIFFGPAIAGWARGHDAAELAQVIARVGAELPRRRARAAEMRDQIAARYSPAAMLDAPRRSVPHAVADPGLPLSRAVLGDVLQRDLEVSATRRTPRGADRSASAAGLPSSAATRAAPVRSRASRNAGCVRHAADSPA